MDWKYRNFESLEWLLTLKTAMFMLFILTYHVISHLHAKVSPFLSESTYSPSHSPHIIMASHAEPVSFPLCHCKCSLQSKALTLHPSTTLFNARHPSFIKYFIVCGIQHNFSYKICKIKFVIFCTIASKVLPINRN